MRCFGLLNSKSRNTLLPCLQIFKILDARARKVCILEIANVERGTAHLVTSQNGTFFTRFLGTICIVVVYKLVRGCCVLNPTRIVVFL